MLSTEEAAEKDFALFVGLADGIYVRASEFLHAGATLISPNRVIAVERSEFAKSRQLRGAQGSPQDQQCYSRGVWQVPFLLVRFRCLLCSRRLTGQAKKMNKVTGKNVVGFE
ncbi:MAG: hypothetical protein ACYC9M_06480 [Desulfobulbaceae bacterium]